MQIHILGVKLQLFTYASVETYALASQKNRLIERFFWVPTRYVLVKK